MRFEPFALIDQKRKTFSLGNHLLFQPNITSLTFLFSFFNVYTLTSSKHNNIRISTYPHLGKRVVERQSLQFQGVEFTEISWGSGAEVSWSICGEMPSRCSGFRATVSCANDGRKFGSLKITEGRCIILYQPHRRLAVYIHTQVLFRKW